MKVGNYIDFETTHSDHLDILKPDSSMLTNMGKASIYEDKSQIEKKYITLSFRINASDDIRRSFVCCKEIISGTISEKTEIAEKLVDLFNESHGRPLTEILEMDLPG